MKRKKLSCVALLLLMFFALGIVAESVALASPVGEWKFDEGHGILTDDSSGQEKTGMLWGSTIEWVEGIRNKALQFASSADYVQAPPSITSGLNSLTSWSITAYIKPTGSSGGYVYSEKDLEGNTYLAISITEDNRIRVETWHSMRTGGWDSYLTDPGKVTRNEWNHLVVTLEKGGLAAGSGTVKCFVDGRLVGDGRLGGCCVSMYVTGDPIPYCITSIYDQHIVWLKATLQGKETKYFRVRKTPGFMPTAKNNILVFYDDFESGVVDSSKWYLQQSPETTVGIFTDIKYGRYSIGSTHRYQKRGENFVLAKIPLGSIPVGTTLKWLSMNRQVPGSYGGQAYFVTRNNQLYQFPYSVSELEKYDVIIKRLSANTWDYIFYRNGKVVESKKVTENLSSYLEFGLRTYVRLGSNGAMDARMDNVIVRKMAPIEPTVTVFEYPDYYVVRVENNLENKLEGHQVAIPAPQLDIISDVDSLEIKLMNGRIR